MQRKQFIGLSFLSILSLLSKRVLADTFKPMADITLTLCTNTDLIHYFDYAAVGVNVWAEITGNAGWIAVAQESQTGSAVGIIIDEQSAAISDEFTISIYDEVEGGALLATWTVAVNVLSVCSTASDICCADGEEIIWLNRSGGLQNYFFNGVRTYAIEQEDEKRYIDYANISRYSTTGKVREARLFTSKSIPQTHIDLLDTLRYSVQAWYKTGGVVYPIMIPQGGYTKYNTRDKIFTANLSCALAEPINIQTQ